MILIYIIIGYLISVFIMLIIEMVLRINQSGLENVETIRDYLNLAIEKVDEFDTIDIIIIVFPVLNIILSIVIILVIILYWLFKITKINVLWNKFLDIRIHKK